MALVPIVAVPEQLTAQAASDIQIAVTASALSNGRRADATARIDRAPGFLRAMDAMPLWAAPIASAVVPGLGQVRLHKDRFVAYMAAEAFLLLQYTRNSREGKNNAADYRALARDIARRSFPGSHPDTVFQYYEKVAKYLESGSFSLALAGPTVPEIEASTFNGEQWVLARQLFGLPLDNRDLSRFPTYQQALAYYESRAIPQAYGWSWRNAQLEKDIYRKSIDRSNEAYRRATNDFIAIIANHIFSAVDAFSTVRLIQAAGGDMRLSASIPIR